MTQYVAKGGTVKTFLMLLMLAVLVGCHDIETVDLVKGANKVKVFRKTDPPAACEEIRPFSVSSGNGCGALGDPGSYEMAYNMFRNAIFEMGGNAGLIENEIPPHAEPGCYSNAYTMNGVAYKCPEEALTRK